MKRAPPDRAGDLRVVDARPQDVGRAIARIDPADCERLGISIGDYVRVDATAGPPLRVLPQFPDARGAATIQLDWMARKSLGLAPGASVGVRGIAVVEADELWLAACDGAAVPEAQATWLADWLDGIALVAGQRCTLDVGGRWREFEVAKLRPAGPAVVMPRTLLKFPAPTGRSAARAGFDDLGGLGKEVAALREIIELPMRRPDLFERLGVQPPRGVLLHGPPGTGKTLIARAAAQECDARFLSISAPEIVHRHYGESEARLRELFELARAQAPSLVFIDEIDAIAPRRDQVQGEVEKRIVAQLLTLLDGLDGRGNVMVIAATNLPQAIDPALRRPGRFDRELAIGIPGQEARREILDVHTRRMPLAADIDLDAIARDARGYTGADLRAVCQEAATRVAVRVARESADASDAALAVQQADFDAALLRVTPTAMRAVEVEVPNTPMDRIGGQAAAKRVLAENVIWPIQSPELFSHFGVRPARGVLMHGPPGTGKTLLARAVATEARANFLAIGGPALLSRYVGDSERAVRELFARARQVAPSIIFFDEFDALAPARGRGGGSDVAERVVATLLAEIDGLASRAPVWLLAATNRPELIDPALLRHGRFDVRVEVGLPTASDRAAILAAALRARPHDPVDTAAIAAATEGWSGADLCGLVDDAALLAIRRFRDDPGTRAVITSADIDAAAASRMRSARDAVQADDDSPSRGRNE